MVSKAEVLKVEAFPLNDPPHRVCIRVSLNLLRMSEQSIMFITVLEDGSTLPCVIVATSKTSKPFTRHYELSFILNEDDLQTVRILAQANGKADSSACCVLNKELLLEAYKQGTAAMETAQSAPHDAWMKAHQPNASELEAQRKEFESWAAKDKPLISIVTPVFNTPELFLQEMVTSICAQSYTNWELVLANASTDDNPINGYLATLDDERIHAIKIENKNISDNTNAALEVAKGDYIAFVDHDDFIEPDTLYRYVEAIHENPEVDLLFCDEDLYVEQEDGSYAYCYPRFKPGWNYDLALTHNYICHLLMVSRRALDNTTRSDATVAGAQDYDLTFKAFELNHNVVHVPHLLYHWREHAGSTAINRDSKPYALEAGRIAIQNHMDRTGIPATINYGSYPFSYRVEYHLPDPAVGVSLLVLAPTIDASLKQTLETLRNVTEYPIERFEIVVCTSSLGKVAATKIVKQVFGASDRGLPSITVASSLKSDALSLINAGATTATFDTLVALDTTCTAIEGNWMTELIRPLQRDDVEISAPLLLSPDRLFATYGLSVSPAGEITLVGRALELTNPGYMSMMFHARDVDYVPLQGAAFRKQEWLVAKHTNKNEPVLEYCESVRSNNNPIVVEPYGPLQTSFDFATWQESVQARYLGSYDNPNIDATSPYFAQATKC